MPTDYAKMEQIKLLTAQVKNLQKNAECALKSDSPTKIKYVSYREYALMYNKLANDAERILNFDSRSFARIEPDKIKSDTGVIEEHKSALWKRFVCFPGICKRIWIVKQVLLKVNLIIFQIL